MKEAGMTNAELATRLERINGQYDHIAEDIGEIKRLLQEQNGRLREHADRIVKLESRFAEVYERGTMLAQDNRVRVTGLEASFRIWFALFGSVMVLGLALNALLQLKIIP